MPQDSFKFLSEIQSHGVLGYIHILLISLWAGAVRYLSQLSGGKFSFVTMLTEMIISGFVGVMAAMGCQYLELNFYATSVITGVCAHGGTRTLFIMRQLIVSRLRIK